MKYYISVQTEKRRFFIHQSLSVDIFTGQKTISQKKSGSFSPKMGGGDCQNPFQAILRLKKERKKVAWTTNSLGGEGGKTFCGPNTKKLSFMCVCPYQLSFDLLNAIVILSFSFEVIRGHQRSIIGQYYFICYFSTAWVGSYLSFYMHKAIV